LLADNPAQRPQKLLLARATEPMPELLQHHALGRRLRARGGAWSNSAGILHLHVLHPSVGEPIPPTAIAIGQKLWVRPPEATIPKSLLYCVSFFLHHAEIVTINGKSYRLRNQLQPTAPSDESKPTKMHAGNESRARRTKSEASDASDEKQAADACQS
jgi:hypothetical protein